MSDLSNDTKKHTKKSRETIPLSWQQYLCLCVPCKVVAGRVKLAIVLALINCHWGVGCAFHKHGIALCTPLHDNTLHNMIRELQDFLHSSQACVELGQKYEQSMK
jgi:hypothetical protein